MLSFFYLNHMSKKKTNLSKQKKIKLTQADQITVAIVCSDWNENITHSLRDAAIDCLVNQGISNDNINHLQVPGAFELPMGAKIANRLHKPDAIICLGCVIKGETDHDKYISQSVASGIQTLNLALDKPVIFGLLTPNSMEQAEDRAGGKYGNKGIEAATTALKMIQLNKKQKGNKIGY